MSQRHRIDLDTDMDGWWWAACECGWIDGPFLCNEDAGDAHADHCDTVVV